jgi:hypothetical protein
MLYAPKNEDVCENIEHKKHEYREEIYAELRGRSAREDVCGPWKCCSPPKEVAGSPPDDSALRMHVALSPSAASQRPARNLKQESQRWSRRNWARCKNRRRTARSDEVRWPGAREKRCRLPTRMSARRVPGRTTTGLDSLVRP